MTKGEASEEQILPQERGVGAAEHRDSHDQPDDLQHPRTSL